MPIRLLLFLLILCCATISIAQQTTIHGKIVDSLQHPISNATITLLKTSNGAGINFAKTDSAGIFSIKIPEKWKDSALAIKASHTGFLKAQKEITNLNELVELTLSEEVKHLEEVKVKSKVYIIQKSDTISFNADFFRDSSDRVLGDLIRKIPGIEVSDNGVIKYNGKELNQFYIEGDDLLDGKYNIATNNIPSKDVDKVEVIEHNQHIKMLNGIVQSNQPALNIRLKDRSKLKWINNAEIGGGTPSRYNISANAMAFKPKFKAINVVKANNVGNDLSDELISHFSNDGIADPMIGIAQSRPVGISKNRYLFNKNHMVNLNDMLKFHSGTTLRLNAYYLHDEQPFQSSSTTTYYLPSGDTVGYNEIAKNRMQINHLQATITLNNNSEKKYFNESIFTDISTTKNPVNIRTNGVQLLENLRTNLNTFSHSINGVLNLGRKNHILNYSSDISYSRNPQNFSVQPGWLQDILNDSLDYHQSIQMTNIPTLTTTNNISFIIKNGYWTFNNKIGFDYTHSKLNSDIFIQQNETNSSQSTGIQNKLNWNKSDGYAQSSVQFEKDRSRINIYFPIHYYNINYKNESIDNHDKLNNIFIAPYFSYNLKIAKEHELIANYQFNNIFSELDQVYGAGIMQSYRSINSYYGTPLKNGYTNKYSLGFAYKKTLKMFFWNINSSYTTTHRYFIYASTITNTSYQVSTLPIGNNLRNFSLDGSISKYLFPLKTNITLSSGLGQSKVQQYQNGFLFATSNWSNNYGIELNPRPADWLRIDIKANYYTSNSTSKASGYEDQKTSQFKQNSALNFIFFKRITAQLGSEYYASYLNGQNLAHCFFLDAYLNYRIYKPDINLRFSCTNLANERNFTVLNASANIISASNYLLQPRMFILSAGFRF
ncbi:peptidase associated domain and porin domain-containing protein [Rhizosphaericola mali]|uniref:TonB-dependent receptor n=1 Tax=Rhizosphaericola mali TaxID=2545455 RepID=A0A5P2G0L6_9BACT|nr:TonB-dependent receptor [Rhizosphaericola mali]QES89344.1 hypothetical protein E0W69_011950 [Rhizosphaericola mali]